MTLNAMTLFPITLSCPIVQNSPKRPYSKSWRNQMREKSITFLSPLSRPWLNYWNKMLHLEESRDSRGEGRAGETLLGTWVPFRLGLLLRKPLKAVNDPIPVPSWEVVSLLWLSKCRMYTLILRSKQDHLKDYLMKWWHLSVWRP